MTRSDLSTKPTARRVCEFFVAPSRRHGTTSYARPRRGAVLAALLICLLLVMLVSAALVRGLVVQHRLVRSESQRLQAIWLAESAVDRAIVKLRSDAGYAGETWAVSFGEPADKPGGVAVIRVEAVEGAAEQRTITIEARWPDDPVFRVLEQRQLIVDLVDSGES